jgi:hypothetical protein
MTGRVELTRKQNFIHIFARRSTIGLNTEIDMSTKSETTKQELLPAVIETRTAILQAASQLSHEEQNTVFLGVWSVKDLIAHLIGWDYANLAAAKDIQAGKLPGFYAHQDKDWKTFNAELVAKYKRDDFEELSALSRDSQGQLIEYLESIPPENIEKDFGVRTARNYKVTIERLMQAELKDGQEHLKQIQDFAATL